MARRKKPQIKGTDPSYDHSFERFRPIPNDMPSDVVVPGLDKHGTIAEPARSETASTADADPQVTKAAPRPKSATPVKAKSTTTEKTDSKPPKKDRDPKPKPVDEKAQEASQTGGAGERQTTLDAAVKIEQAERMAILEEKGLKMKDIVTLAGRRTTERFTLSPEYVPKPDANRLPMKQGYHTSKRLPGDILDAMRKEQDPLGISSDPAMVRGQFELLFWSCLDGVIEELKDRYR